MKHLFACIALFMCISLSAQDTLRLSIDNPAPRVGDKTKLTFSFDFFVEELQSQLGNEMALSAAEGIDGVRFDDFVRNIEFNEAGKQTIGPFEFTFNGEKIVTDAISIDVTEALPFEEGIWIRVVQGNEGQQFLIIEQQFENKTSFKKTKDGFSYTTATKITYEDPWAAVNENPQTGIEFDFRQSFSNMRMGKDVSLYAPTMSYSFKKYEIKFDNDFSGTFVLSKKHMNNLPKKASIQKVKITR